MKYSIVLTALWIWASVLLTRISCQTCRIDTTKLQGLWYLNGNHGYDLNVLPAWRQCKNGTGVTVGVVDRGVQDHIDLDIIYRKLDEGGTRHVYQRRGPWYGRSFGINGEYQTRNNRRQQDNLKHGTRVAGIIAAKYNDIGVTGIAFGAKIADIRIASSAVFKTFDPRLLNHRYDVIDIYSCSFANFHTGTKSYSLLPDQENALNFGTTRGRGNRGSVYVFGTGNSGGDNTFTDSCAYDRLVTNRYVISVAGIQHNLQKLPSGEECAAMLVSAFTASPGSEYTIKTTDINNKTTEYFNQNSAAVPMVSGAVALVLSEKPNLGYRDIMHLLVKTSRSNLNGNGFSSRFTTNHAGIKFSSAFGFGLLDVGSLVESSRTWQNVPPMQQCTERKVFNIPLQRDNNNLIIHISSCGVTYIEHVEVTLSVLHSKAGQIRWVLISPYGTRSTILPGRRMDQTVNMDLTVLTVQLWGENPTGYWKLEPSSPYNDMSLGQGTLNSATITIYGTTCGVLQCLQPARQDVENSSTSPWTEWSQCSVTCGHGYQSRQTQCAREICVGQRMERKTCIRDACQGLNHAEVQTNPSCPSPNQLNRICAEECSFDRECYGGMVCCYNGCGHLCNWPTPGTSRPPIEPSYRPVGRVQTSSDCRPPSDLRSHCREQCSSDLECSSQRVCCFNGCGHTCERPTRRTQNQNVNIYQTQGRWSSWSSWSPCSETCGQGTKTRTRQCRGGNCRGNYFDTTSCSYGNCPSCTDIYEGCQWWIQSNPHRACSEGYCRKTCRLC